QFGEPIANFELIQEKIAEMYTGIAASRLLIYSALSVLQKDRRRNKEAAAAIMFASEAATRSALDCIQIMGGYGYMKEFQAERFMRDAKLLEIGAGTTEIRKIIIAREVLKEGI
ncbi:MAG: isovaleryl-CoA dehydrogenase, partial [Thermoplasmata archaeon]|nr:isovaleryl-CoA dehydrogenase [Candidatus Sysuiplasma superficiale]